MPKQNKRLSADDIKFSYEELDTMRSILTEYIHVCALEDQEMMHPIIKKRLKHSQSAIVKIGKIKPRKRIGKIKNV